MTVDLSISPQVLWRNLSPFEQQQNQKVRENSLVLKTSHLSFYRSYYFFSNGSVFTLNAQLDPTKRFTFTC